MEQKANVPSKIVKACVLPILMTENIKTQTEGKQGTITQAAPPQRAMSRLSGIK
jgi:hypothetical protein